MSLRVGASPRAREKTRALLEATQLANNRAAFGLGALSSSTIWPMPEEHRAAHVLEFIDRFDRQTVGLELAQLLVLAVEGDHQRAASDAVGQLAPVAVDHRLLVDIELFEELLAELQVEARRLPISAAGSGRVMRADLAAPFRIQQVLRRLQLTRLYQIRVLMKTIGPAVLNSRSTYIFSGSVNQSLPFFHFLGSVHAPDRSPRA